MIVVMDEPRTSGYGGIVAAPVFGRIASRWLATLPEVADRVAPREPLPLPEARPAPDLQRMPAAIASNRLAVEGLEVRWPDVHQARMPVTDQAPGIDEMVNPGAHARLVIDPASVAEETTLTPDLAGLTPREVIFWARTIGTDVQVQGKGTVYRQSPEADQPLNGSIQVWMR